MIRSLNKKVRSILLNIKERKAGNMTKDNGSKIEWGDAVQIIVIPWEDIDGQSRKYTISPSSKELIVKKLEQAHWGCVVDLTIVDKFVTDISIVEDVMESLYNNEPIEL